MAGVFREREAAAWTQAGYTLGGMLKARQWNQQYEEFLDNDYEELKAKMSDLNQRRAAIDTSKETDEMANIVNELKVTMNDWILGVAKNYPGNPKVDQAVKATVNSLAGSLESFTQAETGAMEQKKAEADIRLTKAQAREQGSAARARGVTSRIAKEAAPGLRELTASQAEHQRALAEQARQETKGLRLRGGAKPLTAEQIAHNQDVMDSRETIKGLLKTVGSRGIQEQISTADELGPDFLGGESKFSPGMRRAAQKAMQPLKGVPDPEHNTLVKQMTPIYHTSRTEEDLDQGLSDEATEDQRSAILKKGWLRAIQDDPTILQQLKPGHFYEMKFGQTVAPYMWDGENWEEPEER